MNIFSRRLKVSKTIRNKQKDSQNNLTCDTVAQTSVTDFKKSHILRYHILGPNLSLIFSQASTFEANAHTQFQTAPLLTTSNFIYTFIPTSNELEGPLEFCLTPLLNDLKSLHENVLHNNPIEWVLRDLHAFYP